MIESSSRLSPCGEVGSADGQIWVLSNLCLKHKYLTLLLKGFLSSGTHGNRGCFQSFFPVCTEMRLVGGRNCTLPWDEKAI